MSLFGAIHKTYLATSGGFFIVSDETDEERKTVILKDPKGFQYHCQYEDMLRYAQGCLKQLDSIYKKNCLYIFAEEEI